MSNILITSATESVTLVKTFKDTIRNLGANSEVYITDMEPEKSSACKESDGSFTVPLLTSEDYIQVLQSISIGNRVKLVIPTAERELPIMSANKDIFAKLGIYILTPNYEFVMKCLDNHNFSGYLDNIGINVNMLRDINKYEDLIDISFIDEAFAEFVVREYLFNERVDHFDV